MSRFLRTLPTDGHFADRFARAPTRMPSTAVTAASARARGAQEAGDEVEARLREAVGQAAADAVEALARGPRQ